MSFKMNGDFFPTRQPTGLCINADEHKVTSIAGCASGRWSIYHLISLGVVILLSGGGGGGNEDVVDVILYLFPWTLKLIQGSKLKLPCRIYYLYCNIYPWEAYAF